MSQVSIFIIFILFLMLIPIGVAIFFYRKYRKRYLEVKNTETTPISSVDKGVYEIIGKAVSFDKETLLSPIGDKPCVYYDTIVYRTTGGANSDSKSKTIYYVNDKQYVDFGIQDETGKALIYFKDAKTQFKHELYKISRRLNNTDPELKQLMLKYGFKENDDVFKWELSYKQTCIYVGEDIYALGETRESVNGNPVFRTTENKKLYLSNTSEEDLLKRLKRYCTFALIGIAVTSAFAIFAISMFLFA